MSRCKPPFLMQAFVAFITLVLGAWPACSTAAGFGQGFVPLSFSFEDADSPEMRAYGSLDSDQSSVGGEVKYILRLRLNEDARSACRSGTVTLNYRVVGPVWIDKDSGRVKGKDGLGLLSAMNLLNSDTTSDGTEESMEFQVGSDGKTEIRDRLLLTQCMSTNFKLEARCNVSWRKEALITCD